jgi:hypothetical protein
MTRNNVNQRLKLAVARAAEAHPSLAKRHVSPHCIRHYLPFLTMSCTVKNSADKFRNC